VKVLQIVGDSKYGGATYLILEWCKFLVRKGCQVDVLSTDSRTITELQRIDGVAVVSNIFIPREIKPIEDAIAFYKLLYFLLQQKYDVVHTYTSTPGFLGRIAARVLGVPVILHHQAGWTATEFSSFKERILFTPLEYLATLASTKGICVSQAVALQAQRFHIAPSHKLVILCNGIDPQPFVTATCDNAGKELRQNWNVHDDHVLLGNAGRLSPQKDNETLIRALVPLKSFIPDISFTLILAGEGPERHKLEKLVYHLGLGEQVRFLGFCKEIPSFLDAVDIFVSPSLREGLSISLLEAMAAANPIIATNILPNSELIEHEVTGLLVHPKEPEQVARAIARFVNDPVLAQRCGATARQRVLEKYTIDRMFQETWNLYLQLLEENKCD